MLTVEPKTIPMSYSTATLEPLRNNEPQPLSTKLEHPKASMMAKGLGKNLTPEARRIILEIKEKASQIDP